MVNTDEKKLNPWNTYQKPSESLTLTAS